MDESLVALRQAALKKVRRVVVKVGSSILAGGGELRHKAVKKLTTDIAALRRRGLEVVLVTSGAVASGFRTLKRETPPKQITEKQAAAAVGQPKLMAAYTLAFGKHAINVAQVLLTSDDLDHRLRYLNARHTILALLHYGVLPIVNENDSVSFQEIKIGDNDRLSALVSASIGADLLIMLTSVPGLLEAGSRDRVVPVVPLDAQAAAHVDPNWKSAVGTGGMATKVESAQIAGRSGIPTVVACGTEPNVLERVVAGEPLGTFFVPAARRLPARKKWLAYTARVRGAIVIDDGAVRALRQRGGSLLPSGIVGVEGEFPRGAQVEMLDAARHVVARGLCSYSSAEIERIKRLRTSQILPTLGYTYGDEVVHRDDLVVINSDNGSAA